MAPSVVDEHPMLRLGGEVRVVGDRAVAANGRELVFYERGTGEISRFEMEGTQILQSPLVFDGEVAYASPRYPSTEPFHLMAAAFGAEEPSDMLPLCSLPDSIVPVGGALALGFEHELLVVHPYCPPAS